MNRMRTAALVAMLAATSVAWAGQPIDERREVTADALIVVTNVKGEIDIRAVDGSRVSITGELGDGSRGLEVSDGGSRLNVEVKVPRNARDVDDTSLILEVPYGVSLEVEAISADVTIAGVTGKRIEVSTVSGEIEVRADPAFVGLKSVSGDIALETRSRKVEMETVSGDVESEGLSGELDVTTVSGEAMIEASGLIRANFESVSGDLELELGAAESGRITIGSLSGDVDLMLAGELSADVEVKSFSGNIRSDRGEVMEARHGPSKSLSFTAGDGSSLIRIESFSGDVRIRSR